MHRSGTEPLHHYYQCTKGSRFYTTDAHEIGTITQGAL
ncbi:unnamed protein product, partial [Rotaria sp. Silwood2]